MTAGVTVFTSAVYPDLARLWLACVRRVFPRSARIEIFRDTDAPFDEALFPGACLLSRSEGVRDFHDAYNDALRRAAPVLVFVDTDVLLLAPEAWPRLARDLAEPRVASSACIGRFGKTSHGTFAVAMKSGVYRQVLRAVPGGFDPRIEGLDPAVPKERWRWFDTADLATRAVREAGWEARIHEMDRDGGLVRFDGLTLTRRPGAYVGVERLLAVARESEYFWRGLAGNTVLAHLHDAVFPDGPRYGFRVPWGALLSAAAAHGPARGARLVRDLLRYADGALRVARALR